MQTVFKEENGARELEFKKQKVGTLLKKLEPIWSRKRNLKDATHLKVNQTSQKVENRTKYRMSKKKTLMLHSFQETNQKCRRKRVILRWGRSVH